MGDMGDKFRFETGYLFETGDVMEDGYLPEDKTLFIPNGKDVNLNTRVKSRVGLGTSISSVTLSVSSWKSIKRGQKDKVQ